jgi:acetyl-CoA/propionyl-CoA carboxylase biotin carboxyl carrier protein
MPDELSPSEAAAKIGASTRTVQRWIATGRLPARRVGGRWRVANDALDAFDAVAVRESEPDEPRSSVIQTVFVANRGEIAWRIARTCQRLGIAAVLPATDGPDAVDLLDIDAVVAAARHTGADALHPGFGFLAENADFAEAVGRAAIRWVGPSPEAIRTMGDKAAARRLAARLGIPVVPGYDGDAQDDRTLRQAGRRIGFPLLVKPAGGGGGKGMRIVGEARALDDAIAAARREATTAFGDDRLVLERLIAGARHVEVQVLGDGRGAVVHLGERDCSVQRRHQKVLEEAPSPAVARAMRRTIGAGAVRLAEAVGYASAGTCEFLLAGDEAWFIEMNTRLQVEHPVTEAVSGRDLVADQLAIAAGAALADIGLSSQAAIERAMASDGHAIEVRLYAEDAEAGFLPSTGRIEALRWPAGDGIRVDAGIVDGSEIGPRFDPLLAKIVAHGAGRAEALERLEQALDETVVLGVLTNLRFLRWLVRQPWLRRGRARIDSLAETWHPGDGEAAVPGPTAAAWHAAAAALADATPDSGDLWSAGWRVNALPTMALVAEGGVIRRVPVGPRPAPGSTVAVDASGAAHVDVDGRSIAIRPLPPPDVDRAARAAVGLHPGGPIEVVAPMPGRIVAVHAEVGQDVVAGDRIATLEAMKMEHAVTASTGGWMTELTVSAGAQVAKGDRLATIDPGPAGPT